MTHSVKIVKVVKSDKQRNEMRTKKIKKVLRQLVKKSGEKNSFILKIGDDVSGEDTNKDCSKNEYLTDKGNKLECFSNFDVVVCGW